MPGTLRELIFDGGQDPSSVAVMGIDGRSLDYGRLRQQITYTVGALNSVGLSARDRVAIVMPNGPAKAVALLSVIAGFACAPINEAYREEELERHISDVGAKALLVLEGAGGKAAGVGAKMGLDVLELKEDPKGGGAFSIKGVEWGNAKPPEWAGSQDIALMLQTSGTTGKPKNVALTNAIVAHSVTVIKERLGLTRSDRGINVLPLFHVHGQTTFFTSLIAGGSAVCTPGFDPGRFFEWYAAFRPTWFSAVPTMHRAIVDAAQAHRDAISNGRLRFIRSASSALPVALIREMEETFKVPVIEAYGMTEASHGITSNLLPPGKRKAGSVGLPYRGEEIAIMGDGGRMLGEGETGEILIRGDNVIKGYHENPEANSKSFTEGWLRTGDLGYKDSDGYLFIAGRIKDIINRGGEKISPREVEEALLALEGVSQAIVFPQAHPTLGEDVGAAVVLKKGHSADEGWLRSELGERIARHKVPGRIYIVPEIPKGATGKPQRWKMAELLGSAGQGSPAARAEGEPTAVEAEILGIWREVLRREDVGINERFLEAGGDSLRATQLASRIRERLGVALDAVSVFEADTVREMAKLVEAGRAGRGQRPGGGR